MSQRRGALLEVANFSCIDTRAAPRPFRRLGFGHLPICMAKTQESLSDNPKLPGRPTGFRITVREFEIANGAGFLVVLTGKMVRMPALPKIPAAERFRVNESGEVVEW